MRHPFGVWPGVRMESGWPAVATMATCICGTQLMADCWGSLWGIEERSRKSPGVLMERDWFRLAVAWREASWLYGMSKVGSLSSVLWGKPPLFAQQPGDQATICWPVAVAMASCAGGILSVARVCWCAKRIRGRCSHFGAAQMARNWRAVVMMARSGYGTCGPVNTCKPCGVTVPTNGWTSPG